MPTGSQNMPEFPDRQLSVGEKKDIIAYIKNAKEAPAQGGWGLGGIGPATEGLATWIIGIVALAAIVLWTGPRRRAITKTRSTALRSCQG